MAERHGLMTKDNERKSEDTMLRSLGLSSFADTAEEQAK